MFVGFYFVKRADVNDVPKTRASQHVIQENMSVILTWVASGYTLEAIHEKLEEQGVLSCRYSTFKKYYRACKKKMDVSQSDIAAEKTAIGTSQLAVSNPSVVPKAVTKPATQPPVIPKGRCNKAIIFEMMSQICELRSLGYRMPSIHKAFREEGLITCGFSHFKANYYALKRAMEASQIATSTERVSDADIAINRGDDNN